MSFLAINAGPPDGKYPPAERIFVSTNLRRLNTVIRSVNVTRYVTPLREGGSLPAIAEADDGFLYVLKFRGAGQGVKALIADYIGGELARAIGLKVPEIVFATLDEAFGRTEPDEEIQDLLKASVGVNLGLHYLSGAITLDPAVNRPPAALASKIVWLDAFLMNVDRTARNTNMLIWQKELWLIDHGASLYFHHAWSGWQDAAAKPFIQIKDHVLLPLASALAETAQKLSQLITPELLDQVTAGIPTNWLEQSAETASPKIAREVYRSFLKKRLQASAVFLNEAQHARNAII